MSKTIINQCNSGHRFIIQGENKIGEIITVKVEKLPDSKYEFIKWEDGRTDNPRTFDIRECGKYYVAIFEEIDIPTPVPEPELCDKAKIYYTLCEIIGGEWENYEESSITCKEISDELDKIIGKI